MAVDDLLVKLARMFRKQKQQTIFLINNYDMVLAVLKVCFTVENWHFKFMDAHVPHTGSIQEIHAVEGLM